VGACPRCGTENADAARFCQACGASLVSAESAPEERKLVSVLFVDIVGSTSRADLADPEDVRDTLRLFYERVREQIDRFGGVLEKFIGDAVVALFGAPLGRGDDAERAVRCGLKVLEAIEELNAAHPGLELTVRAAVNTGEAVVATGTEHERGEALATGDVVNTASRLQSAAPAGRLVVGVETFRATRRAIRYAPIPPIEAKGKREPVEAWLAIEPTEPGRQTEQATGPILGRDRELELLATIWRRAVDERRPHLVTVLGPPGIGKSRLTAEFVGRAEADGGRALRGRCLPYGVLTGYRASAEQVRQVAGILETDPPETARTKLTKAVAELLEPDEVADVARYLSLLMGLGVDERADDRLELFFAMRRLVEGLGRERPTVVVFEDLHWAEESQLDLFDYLCTHVRDVPVVFLAPARPELADLRPSWGGGLVARTTLPLEPLKPEDAAAIALATLGDRAAFSGAVERLVEVSGGNPLFVEELATSLAEGAGDAGALPTSIREAISSRIDILQPDQRATLLDASVIGKTFWRGVVQAMGTAPNIDDSLESLEARDLIRREPRSQVEGDVEFSFKHVLIRDAAYGMLPRAVRRERHAAVARTIEATGGANVGDLAWVLAHHWREGGERDRAVEYLVMAAERAHEGWAIKEVIALYDDALELVGPDDAERRTRIRLQRALTMIELAEFDVGAAELDEILPELEGREELEAMLSRARAAFWLEEAAGLPEFARRAHALAERLGDPEMLPPALAYKASIGMLTGDLSTAIEFGVRALDSWVPGTRRTDLAVMKDLQANNYYWVGNYAAAEQLAQSAHEMGGEVHNVQLLVHSGGWHGLTLAAMGRSEEAIELLEAIVMTARDLGVPRWAAAPLNYASHAFRDLFLEDEARRRNEEALDLIEKHGEWGMPRLEGSIDLLLDDLMRGDVGHAEHEWPVLWDAAINGAAWRPWLGGCRLALVRAEIARRAEGPEAAVEHALTAIERARAIPRPKYEGAARAILGSAFVDLGRADDGLAELRAALEIADRLGSPSGRWQMRAALGRACYTSGDDNAASAAFHEGADIIRAYAATLTPDHATSFLSAEPVREVLKAAGGGS
jgi:class 3 adenylate cyclase/tetratricopeptide (TPR) repeat protein